MSLLAVLIGYPSRQLKYTMALSIVNMNELHGRLNMMTLSTIQIFNDPLDILNMMDPLEV